MVPRLFLLVNKVAPNVFIKMAAFSNPEPRRTFLGQLAAATAVVATTDVWAAPLPPAPFSVQVFTKHLDGFGYDDISAMAAEAGFDGLDLTVRPAGHVLPERVADDLPRAVAAAKKAGLAIPLIVTALTDTGSPHAETIIRTAAAQGVSAYRTGWINYRADETMDAGRERVRSLLAGLAKLNQTYKIHGAYQNHNGGQFGAPVWDLAEVLQGQDVQYLGCQYDLYHATIEGANSWPLGFRRIHPFVRTMDIKDFRRVGSGRKPKIETVPLSEGEADFPALFKLMKQLNVQPQLSLHFEYALPTSTDGTEGRKTLVSSMKRDLTVLRGWLRDAGLRA
jgi:sugar phosphate isomerase/epimerase